MIRLYLYRCKQDRYRINIKVKQEMMVKYSLKVLGQRIE